MYAVESYAFHPIQTYTVSTVTNILELEKSNNTDVTWKHAEARDNEWKFCGLKLFIFDVVHVLLCRYCSIILPLLPAGRCCAVDDTAVVIVVPVVVFVAAVVSYTIL